VTVHNELYECLDCYHTGPLAINGKCESCHSNSVQSVHMRTSKAVSPLTMEDIENSFISRMLMQGED